MLITSFEIRTVWSSKLNQAYITSRCMDTACSFWTQFNISVRNHTIPLGRDPNNTTDDCWHMSLSRRANRRPDWSGCRSVQVWSIQDSWPALTGGDTGEAMPKVTLPAVTSCWTPSVEEWGASAQWKCAYLDTMRLLKRWNKSQKGHSASCWRVRGQGWENPCGRVKLCVRDARTGHKNHN